ncbi:MAG: M28 family peptidase [Candidatus Zixiibacteriota bacterium]|nr:MAG: M28 family peptidase [candidate division Zixibacteria bacterium]
MIRTKTFSRLATVIATLSVLGLSCGGDKRDVPVPAFNGERAFDYIEKQVSFGPRIPGTENSQKCREYLIDFFDSLGASVDTMAFMHTDKTTGKEILMINVLASFEGTDTEDPKRYLLAAHYDSRPRAEYDPDSTKRQDWIAGANDGASGVAVLMELGNLISQHKPRAGIDMVLLDGEDYGPPGRLDEYFLGAKDMIKRNIADKYYFALVIDMIGDSDLRVFREEFSNRYSPQITDWVWAVAAELGETAFVDSVGYAIHDDHLSFMTVKLQSTVIIDFNYPYWHTTHDTPDKCSPQSLKSVGRVVSTFLYRL